MLCSLSTKLGDNDLAEIGALEEEARGHVAGVQLPSR